MVGEMLTTQQEIEPQPATATVAESLETGVHHFRRILLWPIYLMRPDGSTVPAYGQYLLANDPQRIWHEVSDEFTDDPAAFQERHYSEFVAFLPAVQRFIYGQERDGAVSHRSDGP